LPSYSLAGGIDATYAVAAGKTTVIITSNSPLKHRAVYVGTGQMVFHWVQEGKTQAWRCDTTMLDPAPVQADVKVGENGQQELEVEMPNLYPAGFLMQGRMEGTMIAPAVHVDVPMGTDIWVFLVRSPWFPLKHQIMKSDLVLVHGTDRASASLGVVDGAAVTAQISVSGTSFKKATLAVKRTIGSCKSEEVVGELEAGTESLAWKPIVRSFDLVLVTKGSMSESQCAEVAKGLGAQESSGIFGPGSMQGDFVLCDGPAFSYSWILRGHTGFLENEQDQTDAKFEW